MPRTVQEWIGKTPDSKPPPRVRQRILRAANYVCHLTGRTIVGGDAWEADHVIAIVNGGANRESNMRPALKHAHKLKTARDVAEKANVDAIGKRHFGITQPKGNIPSRPAVAKAKPDKLPIPPRDPNRLNGRRIERRS